MSKPICFNAVKAMEWIAELEAENAHLRGEIKGAKILIWQQKNLVRCRDCVNFNPNTNECFRHGWRYPMNQEDFCSRGERKNNE